MWKRFLISILFRLLGFEKPAETDAKVINEWLARVRSEQGFRMYLQKRDISILRTFGVTTTPRHYDILAGQRLEILSLLSAAENSWRAENKKKLINNAKKEEKEKAENDSAGSDSPDGEKGEL